MAKLNKDDSSILPYEKCIRYGAHTLTDTELIAVLLRTGTRNRNCLEIAEDIMKSFSSKGILGIMHVNPKTFSAIEGIGPVKSVMFSCVGEIASRIQMTAKMDTPAFDNSDMVADYFMERIRHLERENFFLLLLDSKCRMIHESLISIGTVNAAYVSVREIFVEALSYNAVSVIMVHNHPSGDPTPSGADIATTDMVKEAGKLVGISLLDHIIIGDNRYVSFKEKNLI